MLDFVNTVDWRDDQARRQDLLPDCAALAAWARQAGFPAPAASGIRHDRQRLRALRLREVLAAAMASLVDHQTVSARVRAALTAWTHDAWRHRELIVQRGALAWRWQTGLDPVDRVLFELVLDAGQLLLSPDRIRVHRCAAGGCGWFFLDRSKAGRRRWCSMATCGNRMKVQSYRERVAHG